ncbi:MAG: serine protease, partial [Candidatus Delongbacteria bacterium]|nr:serine protease [Candidatus Delongbacteria bacterium]
ILESVDIHPGDELFMFGYPLGYEANEAGYPILRSGKIASYPILPCSIYKTFLLDVDVFQGNSGGPVIFYEKNRYIKDVESKKYYNFIAGLVSQEGEHREYTETINEEKIIKTKLSIAVVIHSRYIKETIDLLKEKR